MKRVLAGLFALTLTLALSAPPVLAGGGTGKELEITTAKSFATTLTVTVTNTEEKNVVDGRVLAYFDNGSGLQTLEEKVHLEPGQNTELKLTFVEGAVAPTSVLIRKVPIVGGIKPGIIIVGTIVDDITPF